MYDIVIPGDVATSQLATGCKFFYGQLRGLSQRDGCIYATNSYLEKFCSLQEKQIQRYLRALSDRGFIHIETDGKHRVIKLSTRTPTFLSGNPDIFVAQNKKNKDDEDYILYHHSACERAQARADVRKDYPHMFAYYTNSLEAVKDSLVELIGNYVDIDAINEIRSALDSIPVYDYCYAMYFDARKLQRIAKNIARRNVVRIADYVRSSFAVPEYWRDVDHMRVLEHAYADS